MTATTSAPAAQLPPGHDDKKSRWYITPELRPHYEPFPDALRRSVWNAQTAEFDPAGTSAERARYAVHVLSESGEVERIRKEHRNDEAMQERALAARVRQIAAAMTADDEAWWLHMKALAGARRRQDKAQAWEQGGRQLWEAHHTCEVCGEVSGSVATRGTTAGGPHRACRPCLELLPGEAADRQRVNGRPRREVVAEWLAKNS